MGALASNAIGNRLKEFMRYAELKQLAYNIAALQQEKRFHSLAVLSYFPGEGKTLLCAALAMAYVETCQARVLVVDTTTLQNKKSLVLKQCLATSLPMVDVMTLEQVRSATNGLDPHPSPKVHAPQAPVVEPEIVESRSIRVPLPSVNDFSLLKKVVEDRFQEYGLVLLDTAPLSAKNKSNIDPLLVARLSDASAFVVSRKLLESHEVNDCLKVLDDPTLHLIGMVANEEISQ